MPLAAALAADGVRPVSFLPSIKCSDCGEEIEIVAMGDHVCEASTPASMAPQSHAASMINPFTLRQLNASEKQLPPDPSPLQQSQPTPQTRVRAPTLGPKPPRISLPKINPDAANRPFLAPRPGAMDSPLSPAISAKSGSSNGSKPHFARSMTSPVPRLYDPRPPSPEMSANLDCAFPPFPTAATTERRPSTPSSQGRRTPTGSERAPSRGGSRLDQVLTAEPEPFNLEPKSPRPNGGENVLQRLNILKSGPFNAIKRQGSGESKEASAPVDERRPSEPTVAPIEEYQSRPSTSNSNYSQPTRPSTAASNYYQLERTQSQKKTPPPRPARPTDEDVLSPSFLGQFSAEPLSVVPLPLQPADTSGTMERSNTFPLQKGNGNDNESSHTLSKMRSEPALRNVERRPSLAHGSVSQPIVPRSDSKIGTRMDYRMQDAPPVPRPVQQYQQDSSHTPSESGSSIMSAANSTTNSSSSGPSPIGSVASSVDTFSPLSPTSGRHGVEENMRVAGLNMQRSPQKPGLRAELPTSRSPPRNLTRPGPPQETSQKPDLVSMTPLESPMDPALLNRSGPAHEPWQTSAAPVPESRPTPLRTKTAPGPVSKENAACPTALSIQKTPHAESANRNIERSRSLSVTSPPQSIPGSRDLSPNSLQPPPIPQSTQPKKHHQRRATNTKATCRGCSQVIEGKSVKAADGRLTGRWHKACFVCRTCQQPFTTADFYVINNEPYCEHHYHEHNGSLCHGCHKGIEGQYLETSSSTRYGSVDKKFHPRCFTCCECRQVLAQDYFEITGKVYCERHALAAMRAQARLAGPGLNPPDRRGLFAERRTTRLINPMMA